MSSPITVGELQVAPGEIGFGRLVPGRLAWSQPLEVPLIVVNGAEEGPRLWLSSCVHGPEATGAEVIRRVVRERVDPKALRGSIVAVPIANPLSFQPATYGTPEDALNLGYVFPGTMKGTITQRLAYVLFQEAKQCDFIIDMHANPPPAMQFVIVPDVPNKDVVRRAWDIGSQFGLTTRMSAPSEEAASGVPRPGGLTEWGAYEGIPGIMAELLYWYRIDPRSAEVGTRGVLNVMKAMGMIDGQVEKQPVPVVEGELSGAEVTCTEGGFVVFTRDAGDAAKKGEVIALIRNPYGDVLEEVKAPVTGWVSAYPLEKNQAALSGDLIAYMVYHRA
jgi:predicted deacylase